MAVRPSRPQSRQPGALQGINLGAKGVVSILPRKSTTKSAGLRSWRNDSTAGQYECIAISVNQLYHWLKLGGVVSQQSLTWSLPCKWEWVAR